MRGPTPTGNDPDWPKTVSGWLILALALALVFGAFVFTLMALAFLIGSSL